ncbi:hypothetical protein VNO77_14934 [Canavalia gladiata]|uniref:Uncharacterized protein n=1 Tax=Canavalia gladiata TaxID=3824 RepID=A0AAN9LZ39_CANGL
MYFLSSLFKVGVVFPVDCFDLEKSALIALGISLQVVVCYAMIGGMVFHIIFASVIIICHITMVPGQLDSLPEGSFRAISLCTRGFY